MTGSPQGRKRRRQYSTTLRQVDLDRFIALLIFFIHIASLRQGVAFASSVSRAQQQQQNRERDLFSHPSGRGEIRRQKKPPRSLLQMVSPFLLLDDDDDDDCCCCSFSKQNERRRRRKEGIPKLTILKKKKERTGRGKGKEKSLVK